MLIAHCQKRGIEKELYLRLKRTNKIHPHDFELKKLRLKLLHKRFRNSSISIKRMQKWYSIFYNKPKSLGPKNSLFVPSNVFNGDRT